MNYMKTIVNSTVLVVSVVAAHFFPYETYAALLALMAIVVAEI